MTQMLPGCPRIDAAQGFAGCIGEPGRVVPVNPKQLYEPFAPEGTAGNQMLWQYSLGIGPSRGARCRAVYRHDADTLPLAVTVDGPSPWVGMEYKLVMFPTQRAPSKFYGNPGEGNEVLQCFDLRRYATLLSFVAWTFETR